METQILSPLKKREVIGGFLYFPMYVLGTQLVITLVLYLLKADLESNETLLRLNFWNGILNLAAVLLIFHSFLWGQLKSFRGGFLRVLGILAIGYAIIIGGNILVNALHLALESLGISSQNLNQEAAQDLIYQSPWKMLLMTVVIAPIVEETFFRGLIFGLLHRKSKVLAYLISILIFGLLHIYQPLLTGQPLTEALLSLLNYLPMGFALAWVFERCRSLWGSIALHAINNLIALGGVLLLQQAGI